MTVDQSARYNSSHEWARKDGGDLVIGISDFAQQSLGDIVYVDLPKVGAAFAAKASFGVIESVKAASDVYLPVAGKITAVNGVLADEPGLINKDCYGEGWLVKIAPDNPGEWEGLLSAAEYGKTAKAGE